MILYLPVSVALLLKISLVIYGRKAFVRDKTTTTLFALLFTLTVCSVIEIIGYQGMDESPILEILLRIYYSSMTMVLALILQLCMLTVSPNPTRDLTILNLGLASILCYVALFTELVISGVTSIGYSVTRVPGEFYWLGQVYPLLMLATSLATLIYRYRKSLDQFTKLKIVYILIALFFLALPIIIVVTLMALGFAINASFIFSTGVIMFLPWISYSMRSKDLFDVRVWLPFSKRKALRKALNNELVVARDGKEMSAKERKNNHERVIILKALLDYTDLSNQKEIAKKIGISESSFSKLRKKHCL